MVGYPSATNLHFVYQNKDMWALKRSVSPKIRLFVKPIVQIKSKIIKDPYQCLVAGTIHQRPMFSQHKRPIYKSKCFHRLASSWCALSTNHSRLSELMSVNNRFLSRHSTRHVRCCRIMYPYLYTAEIYNRTIHIQPTMIYVWYNPYNFITDMLMWHYPVCLV